MRAELQELLRELGLPTLLVTHDYEDAAALADQVGVIVDGQAAPARRRRSELVARPADAFVASFTGANLLHGHARPGRRRLTVDPARERRGGLLDRRGRGRRRRRRLPVGDLGRPRHTAELGLRT